MHIIQQKLLELISQRNIGDLTLREIGKLVGEEHPQKIKHHIDSLKKRGLIIHNKSKQVITKINVIKNNKVFSIPIAGSANCGEARLFTDNNIEGYIRLSSKFIKPREGLIALKAVGNSMNNARINTRNIEEGDFIIVDTKQNNPSNGDYVLSIIDDVCNIKKIKIDIKNKQIILASESTEDYPPIYIHPSEMKFFINGIVVEVMKVH